jgi:hypothetical protein
MHSSCISVFEAPPDRGMALAYRYFVYGMILKSELPLALPERGDGGLGQIELRLAPAPYFSSAARSLSRQPASDSFYQSKFLRDGSTYLRWNGVGEFLISGDGDRITGLQHDAAQEESFQVYLLGQALSYALVRCGLEPLHATAIVVDGGAVVLLGSSGFGKSSLAACFLEAGHRLLTDDLLILQASSASVMAYPGPPRIKLFPQLARRFLPDAGSGVAMNSGTKKLILRLERVQSVVHPVPLRGIYALPAPGSKVCSSAVRISVLPPGQSFLALVKNTFNNRIVSPARLERQFEAATTVAGLMPVKQVSFPRGLSRIAAVRDALLADLESTGDQQAACGG